MTPTGNEHDIYLASKNWSSADCDSVMSANLGFIQGIAECLRAMDLGMADTTLKEVGTALADAAETISCVNGRRERIRTEKESSERVLELIKEETDENTRKRRARDKFFFNHLDEEGWELYKSCFRAAGKTDKEMRQAFEDMLERKSVSTGTNIFEGPASAS